MHRNHLLAALNRTYPEFFHTRVKPISFAHGDVIAEAGAPIAEVVFPRSGMISIVVELQEGDRIEAGMVGRQGAIGGASVFGAKRQINTSYAQIPGTGWSVKSSDLSDLAVRDGSVHDLLLKCEQYQLAQAQQMAACNVRHRIPERLAKWLLLAHDECGEDELQVTQEYLAQMLGVQRASVSMFAAALQDAGLIRYRRGRVSIVDRAGLERQSCECYGALHRQHARIFGHDEETAALPAM